MTLDPHIADLDVNERSLAMESLGKTVKQGQGATFEKIVRQSDLSGPVNVTDWTSEAVRILLMVGRESKIVLSLKNKERYYTIVKYPEGPLFGALIRSIVFEEL